MGLGFGILISSLTTKYRDLSFVMVFFVQIWMYVTPIVYPMSIIPEKFRLLSALNPMTSVVECFRIAFFGVSVIEPIHVLISLAITILIFCLGLPFLYLIKEFLFFFFEEFHLLCLIKHPKFYIFL